MAVVWVVYHHRKSTVLIIHIINILLYILLLHSFIYIHLYTIYTALYLSKWRAGTASCKRFRMLNWRFRSIFLINMLRETGCSVAFYADVLTIRVSSPQVPGPDGPCFSSLPPPFLPAHLNQSIMSTKYLIQVCMEQKCGPSGTEDRAGKHWSTGKDSSSRNLSKRFIECPSNQESWASSGPSFVVINLILFFCLCAYFMQHLALVLIKLHFYDQSWTERWRWKTDGKLFIWSRYSYKIKLHSQRRDSSRITYCNI